MNIVLLDLDTILVLVATVFSLQVFFRSPSLEDHFADPSPPFVDYAGHYLRVCPIRHHSQSSVSCGNQDSIVQGFSPHKCG